MQVGEEQAKDRSSQQAADDIAFLQQAGEEAAPPGWEGLQGERGADAPLAAHGDAEQSAADEKAVQRGREGGGKFKDGEGDDVDHQRGRRPYRSAIAPNSNAPTGRMTSVQKMASATCLTPT